MLIKTHLAITLFFILLFLSNIEHKLVFVLVALLATFIPDIDFKYSKIGKYKAFRILQFFTKHRGIIHSFTFLIMITLFFVLFFPTIALAFFLGYGLHLLADSFTIKGIKPFYPCKKIASGKIRTGGKFETLIFMSFILANIGLLIVKILRLL